MLLNLPPDAFHIYCKAHCGRLVAIPIPDLKLYVRVMPFKDFCQGYVCENCRKKINEQLKLIELASQDQSLRSA